MGQDSGRIRLDRTDRLSMLRKILSPETCAACRLCCGFDCTDTWEFPVLPQETVEAMHRMGVSPKLVPAGEEQTFAAPPLRGEELFFCPMLCETGCTMGSEKPFDCKVWPFRMMRDLAGNVRVAVAGYCPGMERYTDEQLETFLAEEGLGKLLLAYAAEHPCTCEALFQRISFSERVKQKELLCSQAR